MTYLPSMPTCLTVDEVELPESYTRPVWAEDIVAEWKREVDLIAGGTYPTQSILLVGPSGVGKTTAARWIAKQLRLPIFSMLLAETINSYLGSTGKALGSALQYAIDVRGVLVLDELDSVAASREGQRNDVGEVWRITNTFIQSLDHWHGTRRNSLLIGTTNMADSIDSAIRRRFECEVAVPMPTPLELSRIAGVPIPEDCKMSHAEMRRCVLQARRRAVMKGADYHLTLLSMLGTNERRSRNTD